MRLGDLDALKEAFDCSFFNDEDDYKRALRIIDNAPTVDFPDWYKVYEDVKGTLERPQGEWVKDEEHSITINMFRCSNCNGGGYTHFKYCPHCGSRMGGKEE
jgi:hypothetical protein